MGDLSDRNSSDDASHEKICYVLGTTTQGASEHEEKRRNCEAVLSGNLVGQWTIDQRPKPCSKLQDRDDPSFQHRIGINIWEFGAKVFPRQKVGEHSLVGAIEKGPNACGEGSNEDVPVGTEQPTKARLPAVGELLHSRAVNIAGDADHVE